MMRPSHYIVLSYIGKLEWENFKEFIYPFYTQSDVKDLKKLHARNLEGGDILAQKFSLFVNYLFAKIMPQNLIESNFLRLAHDERAQKNNKSFAF